MNFSYLKIKKAAAFSAAFLFVFSTGSQAQSVAVGFTNIKDKAVALLLQNKKDQALLLILNYTKTHPNTAHKNEAQELLISLAQKFVHRDAQEAYENSLNLTLENPKEAQKSNEVCLSADPQQLECLIQKMRLQLRARSTAAAQDTLAEVKALVPNTRFDNWLSWVVMRNSPDFKKMQILKTLPQKGGEDQLLPVILELDRAFLAKNYSRAKDILQYLEKNFPDWPDSLFYRYRIDHESAENGTRVGDERILLYNNKCKSLNKTVARKYRFDFDLCLREI